MKKILFNISELTTCHHDSALEGPLLGKNTSLKNAALVWENDKLIELGDSDSLLAKYGDADKTDAGARAVIPGFVDSHSHLVHAGSRHLEYEAKIEGKSYTELHKSGGILYTVEKTREASEEDLIGQAKGYLDLMLLHGTTTLEAKTGYGLSLEDELKLVRVMKRLKEEAKVSLHLTYLGAHTIPTEYQGKSEEYVSLVESLLPEVSADCDFFDVWCDPLGFTLEQTERLCRAAGAQGLKIKLHVEQTGFNGGSNLAAKLNALSCDHLDCLTDEAIADLAESETVGVLLPSVTYHLREFSKPIPVKKMLSSAMKIALATDFNPGSCPCVSMQRVLEDACRLYGFNYQQALNASTLNAAYALGLQAEVGSLAPGKKADFLLLDTDEFSKAIHQFGRNHVTDVFKDGEHLVKEGVIQS